MYEGFKFAHSLQCSDQVCPPVNHQPREFEWRREQRGSSHRCGWSYRMSSWPAGVFSASPRAPLRACWQVFPRDLELIFTLIICWVTPVCPRPLDSTFPCLPNSSAPDPRHIWPRSRWQDLLLALLLTFGGPPQAVHVNHNHVETEEEETGKPSEAPRFVFVRKIVQDH